MKLKHVQEWLEMLKEFVGEDNWEDFLESEVIVGNKLSLVLTVITGSYLDHGILPVIENVDAETESMYYGDKDEK